MRTQQHDFSPCVCAMHAAVYAHLANCAHINPRGLMTRPVLVHFSSENPQFS